VAIRVIGEVKINLGSKTEKGWNFPDFVFKACAISKSNFLSSEVNNPAHRAGHQHQVPEEGAIHPRAQHGVFWQNCIKRRRWALGPRECILVR